MVRTVLGDTKWDGIKGFLPIKAGDCGVTAKENRRFVEAVLWRVPGSADRCIFLIRYFRVASGQIEIIAVMHLRKGPNFWKSCK